MDEQGDLRRPQASKPPLNQRTHMCTIILYLIGLKQVQNQILQTTQPLSGPHLPPFPILFSTKHSNRILPPHPMHPEAPPFPARPLAVSFLLCIPPICSKIRHISPASAAAASQKQQAPTHEDDNDLISASQKSHIPAPTPHPSSHLRTHASARHLHLKTTRIQLLGTPLSWRAHPSRLHLKKSARLLPLHLRLAANRKGVEQQLSSFLGHLPS